MSDNESGIAPTGGGAGKVWTPQEKMNLCLQALQQLATIDGKDVKLAVETKRIVIDDRGSEGVRKAWAAILKDAKKYDPAGALLAEPKSRKKGNTASKVEVKEEKPKKKTTAATGKSAASKKTQPEKKKPKKPEPECESDEDNDTDSADESTPPTPPKPVAKKGKVAKKTEKKSKHEDDSNDDAVSGPAASAPRAINKKRKRDDTSASTKAQVVIEKAKEASESDKENEEAEDSDDLDEGSVAARLASILNPEVQPTRKSLFGPAVSSPRNPDIGEYEV